MIKSFVLPRALWAASPTRARETSIPTINTTLKLMQTSCQKISLILGWTSINLGNSRPRREQAWNVLFSFLLLILREQQNIRIEAKQLQFQTILSLTPALVTCEWTLLIFLHSCCLGHFLPSILPTLSYVLWTQETLKNLFYHRISVKDRYFGFNSSLTSMISMFDGF